MRTAFIPGFFALLLSSAATGSALCPVEFEADASLMSAYIWRGAVLTDDPVFQPSVTAGFAGFSLNIWGNMDLTDFKDERFTAGEIDYTLTRTVDLPFGEVSAGAVMYTFPPLRGAESTVELILGLATDLPGNPSLTLFRDVDKAEGTYVLFGGDTSIPLGTFPGLDVSASLGWGSATHNRFNCGIGGMNDAFTDLSLTAGLPFSPGETLTIAPTVSSIVRLNEDMRKAYGRGDVVFGFTANAGF